MSQIFKWLTTASCIVFFVCPGWHLLAQPEIVPLKVVGAQHHARKLYEQKKLNRDYLQKTTASDTIPLPFFDDFSRTDLSWAPSRYRFGLALHRIHFFSNKIGRAFGDKRLVVSTLNQGGSWNVSSTLSEENILSVSFFNGGNGWACGSNGFLAITPDSGNTWSMQPSPLAQTNWLDIAFKNSQEGLLADSSGRVYLTTNGGTQWTEILDTVVVKMKTACVGWNQDGNPILAGGNGAKTAYSTNGGTTWVVVTNSLIKNPRLRRIKFFGEKMAIAVGDSGLIFKSLNKGISWGKAQSKSLGYLCDVDFSFAINTKLGWAVGKSGIILATQDGGDSWTQVRSGTSEDLLSVAMMNEYRGWISSGSGDLIHVVIDPSRPESKWWERNSGVYINNNYAYNPVSAGVATFDGTNYLGLPYTTEINRFGGCDTLTSVHLMLADVPGLLHTSFYYQPGGTILQLRPGSNDSLVLQFKTPGDVWMTVWRQTGPSTPFNNPFRFVAIQLADSLKYNGFQFRFINYGVRNGNNEIWNLDYVRLDSEHFPADSSALDLALTQKPSRILKEFHSYPINQYREQFASGDLFADKITSEAINLNGAGLFNNMSGKFRIEFLKQDSLKFRKELETSSIEGMGLIPTKNARKELSIPRQEYLPLENNLSSFYSIRYGMILDADPNFNRFNNNDTLFNYLHLSSYMAYDDGSAEAAIKVLGTNSKGAVRFFLPKTDTLTDIALYFPRTPYTEIQHISFTLILYQDIDVQNNLEYPIFRLPVTLPAASDSLNKFDVFSLRIRPIQQRILEGGRNFYIGWQNTVIDNGNEVALGLDINSSNPGNFFFTQSGSWKNDSLAFPIMIRPVFGEETPTSVKPTISAPKSPFFPNPAQDKLFNHEPFQNLKIFNALGQLYRFFPFGDENSIIRPDLEPGIYLLHWQEPDGRPVSQKLMIKP